MGRTGTCTVRQANNSTHTTTPEEDAKSTQQPCIHDARIHTTHNTHRCASVDGATYVHHTEMQRSFGLHRGMLTFRRTTINSDRAKINVSPVLIGFFFSGVNLR